VRAVDAESFETGKALEVSATGAGHQASLDLPLNLAAQSVTVLSLHQGGASVRSSGR
jgi:hypothetical protein